MSARALRVLVLGSGPRADAVADAVSDGQADPIVDGPAVTVQRAATPTGTSATDVDALCVVEPVASAAGVIRDAIAGGAGVWLEQPLGRQEAERCGLADAPAGRIVAVAGPAAADGVREARGRITGGALGLPWGVHLSAMVAGGEPGAVRRALAGAVATTVHLTGLSVLRAHATTAGGGGLDDAAITGVVAGLELERHGRASLVVAVAAAAGSRDDVVVRVRGSRGSWAGRADGPRLRLHTGTGATDRVFEAGSGRLRPGPTDVSGSVAEFVLRCRIGASAPAPVYTVQNALHVADVLDALLASSVRAAVVDVGADRGSSSGMARPT